MRWWKRPPGAGVWTTEADSPEKSNPTRKPKTQPTVSQPSGTPVPRTKLDTLRQRLRRKKGASLAELCNETRWQAHSVRAALSRLGKHDHHIVRTKQRNITRYRMVEDR